MKKIIALILSLVFVVSFTACGDKNEKKSATKKQSKSDAQVEKEITSDITEAKTESSAQVPADTANQETVTASADTQTQNTEPENTKQPEVSEPVKQAESAPKAPETPTEQTPAPAVVTEPVYDPVKQENIQVVPPMSMNQEEFIPDESQVKKDTANWKQFLKEYDQWADSYVAVMKKFRDNPTDASVASDYQNKFLELRSWTERSSEVQLEIENTSKNDVKKYQEELKKITTKLSEVMPQAAQD